MGIRCTSRRACRCRWRGPPYVAGRCGPVIGGSRRRFRDTHNCISSPEVVVRTSLQKRVGGYDLRLPHTGDIEMWMRLAAYGDVGYLRGVDQAFYRVHGKNMTRSRTELVDLRQRRLAYEAVLERCGDRLQDSARLSDILHRKLWWEALWSAARAYDRGRTEQIPVDELVAFAFDCWPEANTLPVYRSLQLRRHIGPPSCHTCSRSSCPQSPIRRRAGGGGGHGRDGASERPAH